MAGLTSSSSQVLKRPMGPMADTAYTNYLFLSTSPVSALSSQDLSFLESQGCLRVPMRPLLDDFLEKYFLYVHPLLPLIDEGDFWETYHATGEDWTKRDPISLCLFQAMLFSASSFVSQATCQALGCTDIRCTRAMFLKRAKLLFDMDAENSPLSAAQAALLLSYSSFSSRKKPDMKWLSIAIENARLVDAHLYADHDGGPADKRANLLKRVWWCCIMRDRSVSLLMRRPMFITHEHFDLRAAPLVASDFDRELDRSRVYDATTKAQLAQVIDHRAKLDIILTNILQLAFPPTGAIRNIGNKGTEYITQLGECDEALKAWNDAAAIKFPTTDMDANGQIHDSVRLYRTLMYMYYHTARMVICHHRMMALSLLKEDAESPQTLAQTSDPRLILDNRNTLQDALLSITSCQNDLIERGLIRWLPISAIGFAVHPLILSILDAKLSSSGKVALGSSSGARHHHLNTLMTVMQIYSSKYDAVDWANEIVDHAITLAEQSESPLTGSSSAARWTDIFAFKPQSYFRIVLTVDIGISQGRLAQEGDFPVSMQGWSFKSNMPRHLSITDDGSTPGDNDDVDNTRLVEIQPSQPEMNDVDQSMHLMIPGLDEFLLNSLESISWDNSEELQSSFDLMDLIAESAGNPDELAASSMDMRNGQQSSDGMQLEICLPGFGEETQDRSYVEPAEVALDEMFS